MVEGFVDFLQIWPKNNALITAVSSHQLVVGNAVPQYVDLDVEHMPQPMLAWIIAYGFRPRAVHFRSLKVEDAPFANLVLQHQQVQEWLGSADVDATTSWDSEFSTAYELSLIHI